MAVHDFSLAVKQVRVNTFCLMLLLIIPQVKTSFVFVFNSRFHIVPGNTRIICKHIVFLKVSRNPTLFEPVTSQKLESVRILLAAYKLP